MVRISCFLGRFSPGRFTHRRNGRRRTLLGLIGFIWLLNGWAIFTSPIPNWNLGHLPSILDEVLQNHWSGVPWAVSGLVGISAAVLPRRRLPDAYGFTALLTPALVWTVLYSCSWLISLVTHHFGNPRAWVMASIWFFAVSIVGITSGWPDPTDLDEAP